jgi:hypothetical protein
MRNGQRRRAIHYFGEASKLNPRMSMPRRNARLATRWGRTLAPVGLGAYLCLAAAPAARLLGAALIVGAIAWGIYKRVARPPHPDDPKATRKLVRTLRSEDEDRPVRFEWIARVVGMGAAVIFGIGVVWDAWHKIEQDSAGWGALELILGWAILATTFLVAINARKPIRIATRTEQQR